MLLGFGALVSGLFFFRTVRAHNSGWQQQVPGALLTGDEKIPLYKIPSFWLGVATLAIIAAALIFIVAPDYKGVSC